MITIPYFLGDRIQDIPEQEWINCSTLKTMVAKRINAIEEFVKTMIKDATVSRERFPEEMDKLKERLQK